MYRILYVCTGNTCRSPIAEGILKKFLSDQGIVDVEVSSAGTGTLDGYPATMHAVMAAKEKGVDISDHHSTRMSAHLAEESDLIFALANSHFDYLQRYRQASSKVYLLKTFPEQGPVDNKHSVKDPIGQDFEEYQRVADELEWEIKRVLPEIINRIKGAKK
jgi:protein-tyrosine-phosphatase